MTEKQNRFVEEYMIDLNAKQAAIRAGYSPKSADKIGSELLDKTGVAEAIAKARAARSRRTGISADRVLREIARLAFADPMAIVDFKTGEVRPNVSEDDRMALAGVKVKYGEKGTEREVKLTDKLRALEMLGKHLGLFDQATDSGAAAVSAFLQALHPAPGDIAALYAEETDDAEA